jgi:hypothetical protein
MTKNQILLMLDLMRKLRKEISIGIRYRSLKRG